MLESSRLVPTGMTLDGVILRETLQEELGRVRMAQKDLAFSALARNETDILASRFEAMLSLTEASFGTMNNSLEHIGVQLDDICNAISCLVATSEEIVCLLESIRSEIQGVYQLLRESQANLSRQFVEQSYHALRVKRLTDAEKFARRAIEERGTSTAAWFSLALVLIALKRRSDAVDALETARDYATSGGELANVCVVLSRVYLDFGRIEEAFVEADKASKASPTQVGAWMAVCEAQAARDNSEGLKSGIRELAYADSGALGALFVNRRLKGYAVIVEGEVAKFRAEQIERIRNQKRISTGDRRGIAEVIADLCTKGPFGGESGVCYDDLPKIFAAPSSLPIGSVMVE